jgi:wyosine [tRNA(Phe)-imidazoG37] synthetase (radical SAM superfamily)
LNSTEGLAFGPVPSRRLGKSLGINNVPPKVCTYTCAYCQIGTTLRKKVERIPFFNPLEIYSQVKKKVDFVRSKNLQIDYITFVPDGEPTLDINIKETISLIKKLDVPLAIITNSSLLWQENVRDDISELDLVSIKVDTVTESLWKKINRPHKSLNLDTILDGVKQFSSEFNGTIISETMLLDKLNYEDEFNKIARFLKSLEKLEKAYIAIPIRPPFQKWVKPPNESVINRAFQTFSDLLGYKKVEYLIGYEGNSFTFTGNVKEDLLSITAVHPMRKEAIIKFLEKANSDWHVVETLVEEKKLIRLEYQGNIYYMRKLYKNSM